MKNQHIISIILIFFGLGVLNAQEQPYTIPLSNPGQPGSLEIDVYNPSITITGHSGNEVELFMNDKRVKTGRQISGPDFLYNIVEKDNNISITKRGGSSPRIRGLTIELKVPHNFDLKVYTYFGPFINISGITGEIEVEGYFTDVQLENLQSNVIASTNQGKLSAKFDRVTEDHIIFISNYKGALEVSFPSNTKATLLMDNHFGKFKSDFKLGLDTRPDKKDEDEFIWRTINGGGTEIKLVNYYKDIFIYSH